MKKFIPLLLAVFAVTLASCEKDPDMDKLDNNYLVYTNYDKKADFKTFETYYLPDSILVIGDKENAEYWKDAPYWGNWGGWYYPYAVNYSYSTGSFISELLNLEAPQGQSEKLPVLWTSYMSGLLSGSTSVNTKLAVQGVNQAFTQSTYLTNK